MIEVVPLTPEHLTAFEPETLLPAPIPEDQFGQAAVLVVDGKPLAICLVCERDGEVEIGLVMSEAARRYPVALYKTAQQMLAGLHHIGYARIRTSANNGRDANWLRHLGFRYIDGDFVKWQ